MNLIHEEIKAIQVYIAHLQKAIPLEVDSGKKLKMKRNLKELNTLLEEKLEQCGDYKG